MHGLRWRRRFDPEKTPLEHRVLKQVRPNRVKLRERILWIKPLFVITAVLLAIGISILLFSDNVQDRWFKIVTAVSGAAAFLYGFVQWRGARHETSYDRYYDRLNVANERFDAYRIEQFGSGQSTFLNSKQDEKISHLNTMFVFAELDVMEYILGKYYSGYVNEELAARAIRAFHSRCDRGLFCKSALYWVGADEGEQKAKGYHAPTRETVRAIIDERVSRFSVEPIRGQWELLWLDKICLKVKEEQATKDAVVLIAVGCNSHGQAKMLGFKLGECQAEVFSIAFLRELGAGVCRT